jgi:hypothetical protein
MKGLLGNIPDQDAKGKARIKRGVKCDSCHKNKASKAFYNKAYCSTCWNQFYGAALKKHGL